MKKRLYRIGLITTPIFAIYGITPFYIFNKVDLKLIIPFLLSIVVFTFLFWVINIWIINSMQNLRVWQRYLLSYGVVITINFICMIAANAMNINEAGGSYLISPLLSVIAINTIILIICNSVILAQKKEHAELEIERLKVSELEAQKLVLIQQLQPHFLFNTLSTLKSLIKESPDEAEQYTVKLSKFLRYSIQAHQSDLVTLQDELKFTNDYIALQKVRFQNSFSCTIHIPESALKLKIPIYALQTLIENAIKHNAFTNKKPLSIQITYLDEKVFVTNNKLFKVKTETSGTGLRNLNSRYKIISGKEIDIVDSESEFCVTLNLL